MTHQNVPYEKAPQPSWTDAHEFTQGGSRYLQGTCPRCAGITTRRRGSIIVQGAKEAVKPKPFTITCECGNPNHDGRPEKERLGCGAFWYSEPVEE